MGTIQRQGIINTVIVYIGVALGFLNIIVINPYLLTKEEFGFVRIIISFGGFLTIFFSLGSTNMCVRYFPIFRDKSSGHHGFFGFLMLVPLIGVLVGGAVMWLFNDWIVSRYIKDSPLFVHYFFWVFPLGVVMTFTATLNSYANSLLKTIFVSALNDLWVRIVLILFTFCYAWSWISFNWFVACIWLTYFSQLALLIIYIYRVDGISLSIDWSFVRKIDLKKITQFTLFFTLTGVSSLSLKFLDTIMIGAYLAEGNVGVYAIGAYISQFIETPLNSLERVAGIKIAHAFQANNFDEIREIYYKSVRYLFLLGGFLGTCVITCIHDLLKLLPAEYHDAAGVTIIASCGSIFNMATGVNSPIINNSSKYFWNMIFLFILLVFAVVLNMILIPRLGINGAAIATVISSMMFNLMKFLFIWKNFKLQPYDMKTLYTILVIVLSGLAAWFIPVQVSPLLAILIKGTVILIVYLSLTYVFKILPEYNDILKARLRRR